MAKLSDRPTPDLIVIFLAGVVGVVLVLSVLSMLWAFAYRPEADLSIAASRVGTIVSSLVTGIIGYIAGRGMNGRNGKNGSA